MDFFLSWEEISNLSDYNYSHVYLSSKIDLLTFNNDDDYELLKKSTDFIITVGDSQYFGIINPGSSHIIKIAGISFLPICNISSSELNKVNLKKCRNVFIEDRLEYICIPSIKVVLRDYGLTHDDCRNAIINGNIFELAITKILIVIREKYLGFVLPFF